KAQFLSAGGVAGVSPGSYVAIPTSQIDTVTIDKQGRSTFSSAMTAGMLNASRWYGAEVTLPTGQVAIFNGADRDEVVDPGSGTPNRTTEIFDPTSGTWTLGPSEAHGRTYHNSAVLLPDGSVLVGGHAPIPTNYAAGTDAETSLGFSSYHRDPSFQVYKP